MRVPPRILLWLTARDAPNPLTLTESASFRGSFGEGSGRGAGARCLTCDRTPHAGPCNAVRHEVVPLTNNREGGNGMIRAGMEPCPMYRGWSPFSP